MKRQTAIISTKNVELPQLAPCSVSLRQSWQPDSPEAWTLWTVFPSRFTDEEVRHFCLVHFPIISLYASQLNTLTHRTWLERPRFTRTAGHVLITQSCGYEGVQ